MKSSSIAKTVGQLMMALMATLFVFPIVVLVISSFKDSSDVFAVSLIPDPITVDSLKSAITSKFLRSLGNSILVSSVVTVVALLLHSMCGYALARLRFPLRGVAFGLILATLMIPVSAILVPQFMVAKSLGMTNSYAGIIIPQLFNAYGIFLFRQFYLDFPKELEEASELDGCSILGRYFRVVLPLSRPMIVPLVVAFFLGSWNNYLWPLVINKKDELNTVQVYLANLVSGYSVQWNVLLATAFVSVLPMFVLFFFIQRQLKEGIATSGIK